MVTDSHYDITVNVVVDDDTDRACLLRVLYLFLEGDVATLNEGDLALNVKADIVRIKTKSGNGYVLIGYLLSLNNAKHIEEIILLCARVNGGLEEYDLVAVCIHVLRLLTVDGGNRHGHTKARGRADGRRVGVVGLVGVTALSAVAAAVVVRRRNNERDAYILDSRVGDVLILLFGITLVGEAAGRAERHIDSVNAKNDSILKSGDDIALVSASFAVVTEHLHNSKLSIDGNTGDLGILTCDNAGNVSSVAVLVGHDVGILIGIVIAVNDLVAGNVTVINLASLKVAAGEAVSKSRRKDLAYKLSVVLSALHLVGGERGVSIIASGIKDSNERALTGIGDSAAVENTRAVNVNGVLYRILCLVGVGEHNSLNLRNRAKLLKLLVGCGYKSTVKHMSVSMLDRIDKTCTEKIVKDSLLILLHLAYALFRIYRISVLLVGDGRGVGRIGIISDQAVIREGDDNTDRAGKRLGLYLLKKILLDRGKDLIAHLLGDLIGVDARYLAGAGRRAILSRGIRRGDKTGRRNAHREDL